MPYAVTRGVLVEVESQYVPNRSSPDQHHYFFAYTIRISNTGESTVQLLSRHWIIEDAAGRTEEVKGPGVIGQQPVLAPGQTFQYTSACPLPTPFGSMHGTYQMALDDGTEFRASIPLFELAVPTESRGRLLN